MVYPKKSQNFLRFRHEPRIAKSGNIYNGLMCIVGDAM